MQHAPSDPQGDPQLNAVAVVQAAVDAPDDDTPELRAERALVAQWAEKIKRAQDCAKDVHKEWKKWRRYAAGKPEEGKADWLVNTNLIEATIEGLLPNLYAQDPDVSVTPADAVDPRAYQQVRGFAKTVETVTSRMLWEARMKQRMQRMIRSAIVLGLGWIKVAMQLDTVRDPIIERRIADLQAQMQRVGYLAQLLTDPTVAQATQEAATAELQSQIQSLQEKVEVMKATGLVIDTLAGEDVVVDDELRELADYQYANWITHRIWYSPEAAKEKFGLDDEGLKGAASFTREKADNSDVEASQYVSKLSDKQTFLAAWEIWDKQSNTVYTMIEGVKQWVRPPFPPQPAGKRFYPFFLLAFHWQPDMRYPQSDVAMWHKLQDEYARTRSSYAEQRHRTKPARVFNNRAVSVEDAKKLFDPDINEGIGVDPQGDVPMNQLVGIIPYPPIDAALYDTSAIRYDLEQLSGLGDAQRAAIVKPKTATEASIIENSAQSRLTVRQDAIEDVMEEVCIYIAELSLQSMTQEDAAKYAGTGAVWPSLPLEQIHTLLDISIRAGTTGKPNQQHDQQVWTQLGPQLWQAVGSISQAQANQDFGLVEAYKNLLGVTLDRFNLKIEVNEIVPQSPPVPKQPPPPDSKQDDVMIRNGSLTIDEARAKRGLPPLPGALGATPLVYTKTGAIPLSQAIANGTPIPAEVVPGAITPPGAVPPVVPPVATPAQPALPPVLPT